MLIFPGTPSMVRVTVCEDAVINTSGLQADGWVPCKVVQDTSHDAAHGGGGPRHFPFTRSREPAPALCARVCVGHL